jgi:hypothetical protein
VEGRRGMRIDEKRLVGGRGGGIMLDITCPAGVGRCVGVCGVGGGGGGLCALWERCDGQSERERCSCVWRGRGGVGAGRAITSRRVELRGLQLVILPKDECRGEGGGGGSDEHVWDQALQVRVGGRWRRQWGQHGRGTNEAWARSPRVGGGRGGGLTCVVQQDRFHLGRHVEGDVALCVLGIRNSRLSGGEAAAPAAPAASPAAAPATTPRGPLGGAGEAFHGRGKVNVAAPGAGGPFVARVGDDEWAAVCQVVGREHGRTETVGTGAARHGGVQERRRGARCGVRGVRGVHRRRRGGSGGLGWDAGERVGGSRVGEAEMW